MYRLGVLFIAGFVDFSKACFANLVSFVGNDIVALVAKHTGWLVLLKNDHFTFCENLNCISVVFDVERFSKFSGNYNSAKLVNFSNNTSRFDLITLLFIYIDAILS